MRLVLASNNAKKLAELRALLAGLPLEIVTQGELGIAEAEEPHGTFVENALVKARHAAAACHGAAIADDSGLCVSALGGAPGVISAHYAGEVEAVAGEAREERRRRQDAVNNALLLQRLHGAADRRAHFISTLVALRHADDPEPLIAVGRWPGEILHAPRGTQGFGYDPLMFIAALGATVAELDAERKNRFSHRARSAAALRVQLHEAWHLGS
ncbi:RdgB/HAM1 family non-canonical purine NTP pyrophosphatase [Aquincola sp. S2]|uniref:dITP/XTP pyrophosphatase n=1 Tax=Pseudaquabacterium terrae TaxID=2732868 RepID=A0ABX2ENK4_9BURK|nr:RdgB/HAM1 family non-canonical purine NTP pyrophosphatase [Aquabacterium terrae]NRF70153.1 RdgB/HAM1 family non-canonical purine NTP pyrophosphatase [Aquabacterium terrae]